MNVDRLAEFVAKPEVHRRVLGKYQGAYALGVTELPNQKKAALSLSVEGEDKDAFPHEIELDGEKVPVIVQSKWSAPRPQK
jgi:hypothetical protein